MPAQPVFKRLLVMCRIVFSHAVHEKATLLIMTMSIRATYLLQLYYITHNNTMVILVVNYLLAHLKIARYYKYFHKQTKSKLYCRYLNLWNKQIIIIHVLCKNWVNNDITIIRLYIYYQIKHMYSCNIELLRKNITNYNKNAIYICTIGYA